MRFVPSDATDEAATPSSRGTFRIVRRRSTFAVGMRGLVAAAATVAVAIAACSLFTDSAGLAGASAADGGDGDALRGDADVADVVTTDAADAGGDSSADANAYRDAVLADKPLAYWPFDEAAGSSFAKDIVGGQVASVVKAATFGVAGAVKGAVAFDGTGYLTAGDHFDFVGAQPFSIELWAKTPGGDGNYHNLVEKRATVGSTLNGYVVYFLGDDAGTQINAQEWFASGASRGGWGKVTVDELVHFVWTFDGAKVHLYVDAIESPSNYTADGGPIDTAAELVIGGGYKGIVDELALYDHALTIERVSEHYALGRE